ncbi:hypothetical protein CYY_000729 [Polysphondylium violaceum]|uniref:V-type proton ATPase subunit G n=1 Tax=Polysphondylium violaceum TaxID=133409 RepID=A0A8J4PZ80_9MYCE|nr:hypothetical protein CYY_000729 [Polysphondylium violaceum]
MAEDGIKKLFEVEKKAQKMIADARADRAQKLKKAQEEAEKEIKEFKEKEEKKFKEYEAKFMGSSSETASQLAVTAGKEIEIIRKATAQNKDVVVDLLLKYACEVDLN